MKIIECVAFMLFRGDAVLAERRKQSKSLLPGAILLPGGHMEAGESPQAALHREVHEELEVAVEQFHYVCTLLDGTGLDGRNELRKLHYFAVLQWTGEIQVHEAEELLWLEPDQLAVLDAYVDQLAVAEYRRIYQPTGE